MARRGPKWKTWFAPYQAASCRKCGRDWGNIFDIYDKPACPSCGHREPQSAGFKAAFPGDPRHADPAPRRKRPSPAAPEKR